MAQEIRFMLFIQLKKVNKYVLIRLSMDHFGLNVFLSRPVLFKVGAAALWGAARGHGGGGGGWGIESWREEDFEKSKNKNY